MTHFLLFVLGLRYAVFGLGNSTYEHYNAMGKITDKRLNEMGGKRVHPLGLGDDDINIEDDFVQWKEAFWNSVCEEFKLGTVLIKISGILLFFVMW